MPKAKIAKMNKYGNGKIYKITNTVDDLFYIGGTTAKLETRFRKHKYTSKKFPTRLLYAHVAKHGWDKFKYELVELYPCANKTQLLKRERHYCDLLKPQLNKLRPYVNEQERKLCAQEYVKNNHEFVKQSKRKNYRKYRAKYLKASSLLKKKYNGKTFECPCGLKPSILNIRRHERQANHIKRMKNKIEYKMSQMKIEHVLMKQRIIDKVVILNMDKSSAEYKLEIMKANQRLIKSKNEVRQKCVK